MTYDTFYPSAPSDYASTSLSVTFATNVQTRTVTVPIVNDNIYEGSESFSAEMSLPSGSTGVNIGDAVPTATIQDDDGWLVRCLVLITVLRFNNSVEFYIL